MMLSKQTHGLLAFVLAVTFLWPLSSYAFELPPNDGLVTVATRDDVVVLTKSERDALSDRLIAYDQATSNQIAIVIVQSLQGEPIENVALEIGRSWGIGSSKDNGILILFSYDDREVRIEVGYGLEGAVPDVVASGIIEQEMIPFFREGKYEAGFSAAVDALEKHIGGEYTADRYASSSSDSSGWPLFLGFILFQWLLAILGRSKSWWLGGVLGGIGGVIVAVLYNLWLMIPILVLVGLFLDYVVSKNYHQRGKTSWWAGGGGGGRFGGGRGGGFGGFGGGSFGGGGASGRW